MAGAEAVGGVGTQVLDGLVAAFVELDETGARALVGEALAAGETALAITQAGERGMRLVGERYEEGTYFLSALIMAGEMFKGLLGQLGQVLEPTAGSEGNGRVLLGTVAGDIHDIGKNLVGMALRAHGFLIEDLGIDVSPASFVDRALSFHPDVVGLSGLTSASYESMRKTVAVLRARQSGLSHLPVVIGGASVDEQVGRYVEADAWAGDAMEGVRVCQQLVGR